MVDAAEMIDSDNPMDMSEMMNRKYSLEPNDLSDIVIKKKAQRKHFRCQICQKGFRDNYNLSIHEKSCGKRRVQTNELSNQTDEIVVKEETGKEKAIVTNEIIDYDSNFDEKRSDIFNQPLSDSLNIMKQEPQIGEKLNLFCSNFREKYTSDSFDF